MDLYDPRYDAELTRLMILKKGSDVYNKDRSIRFDFEDEYEEDCRVDKEEFCPLEEFASELDKYEFFETEYVDERMFILRINSYLAIHKMMKDDNGIPEEFQIKLIEKNGCLYIRKDLSQNIDNWLCDKSNSGLSEYLHFVFH